MKKAAFVGFVLLACSFSALAGQDATEGEIKSAKMVKINGTNAVEVLAIFPTSWWLTLKLEISTDLTVPSNWSGVKSSEQVRLLEDSPMGELPMWRRWWLKTDSIIGYRALRVSAKLP